MLSTIKIVLAFHVKENCECLVRDYDGDFDIKDDDQEEHEIQDNKISFAQGSLKT